MRKKKKKTDEHRKFGFREKLILLLVKNYYSPGARSEKVPLSGKYSELNEIFTRRLGVLWGVKFDFPTLRTMCKLQGWNFPPLLPDFSPVKR